MNDTLIETTVDQFVNDQKGFTSVDICNAIKTAGTWVRNREVAAWLRRWSAPIGYSISKVTVELDGGDTVQAGVYLPNTLCIADYTTTSQEAMKPADFEALHGFDPTAQQADNLVANTVVDDGSDGGDGSQSTSVGAKLRTMFNWPK